MSAPVVVIDTGGTIGAAPRPDGTFGHGDATPSRALVNMAARRQNTAVHYTPWRDAGGKERAPVDSSAIGPGDWPMLCAQVRELALGAAGVVILHGTDTLAHTATALSLGLGRLPIPVVLTGAQRPASMRRSDGPANVTLALSVAAGRMAALTGEIVIAFDGRVMRGSRATKISTTAARAFASPSLPELRAAADNFAAWERWRETLPDSLIMSSARFEGNVAHLVIDPGADFTRVRQAVRAMGARGVVVELFGVGAAPHGAALAALADELMANGVPVLAISQTRGGSIEWDRYASTAALARSALISGGAMTREAAAVKMMWALAAARDSAAVRTLLMTNIAGERDD